MADTANPVELLELAQARKQPALPKPDGEQLEMLRRKNWATDILNSESKLQDAQKEIARLFESENKEKTVNVLNALRPAFSAALAIYSRPASADERKPDQLLQRFSSDLAFAMTEIEKVPAKPGALGLLTGEASARALKIAKIQSSLSDAADCLKQLAPYLSDLAGRPRPDQKPDPDRPHDGRVVAA